MEATATRAITENNKITADFVQKERATFELIKQQQKNYENLIKMQMEKAVIIETLEFDEEIAASSLRRKRQLER